jgi:hypothetical protein
MKQNNNVNKQMLRDNNPNRRPNNENKTVTMEEDVTMDLYSDATI